MNQSLNMFISQKLEQSISDILELPIAKDRKAILEELIHYVTKTLDAGKKVNLNFICTHNSRRSQISQVWAHVAAFYYGLEIACFSGGVEVTAFNPRAILALKNQGFKIDFEQDENPVYKLYFSKSENPITAFSKLYSDPANPNEGFAAVMTCDHADQNCPFIPGAEARISLQFEDPKKYDDTPLESEMYSARSLQIASELFYAFKRVKERRL
ncbi:arsenate reductase [Algoriphagus iocasae]|uniref:Arsenate reductase n=1 Tax=Algoriphagus iocasae TaxID=1836499 RepID=A0A841MMT9_9BACT|nr:protein-tyrosine-phosphatase [Algoriphagus iocasae]MBB6325536.1 arsenate reductase [Algoriphagus iocasae]